MSLDVSEAEVARKEVALWLEWTLATAGRMLLGLLPFLFLTGDLHLWLARVLVLVTAGFLVGFLQWSALRPYLTYCVDWILHEGCRLVSWVRIGSGHHSDTEPDAPGCLDRICGVWDHHRRHAVAGSAKGDP